MWMYLFSQTILPNWHMPSLVLIRWQRWWPKDSGTNYSVCMGFLEGSPLTKEQILRELISELLEISRVKKSHTTPYHTMRNGQTERFNRTLGKMIHSLPTRAKVHWAQMIQTFTFAYNCTIYETTGFALPPTSCMGVFRDNKVVDYDDFVN